MGQSRPLFVYFRSFHTPIQMTNTNWKKHRWCAWDSNPGRQDGRRRRIHWAIAAPQCGNSFKLRIATNWSVDNVTRFGEISPLRLEAKELWPFWKGSFCIRQTFEHTLVNFIYFGPILIVVNGQILKRAGSINYYSVNFTLIKIFSILIGLLKFFYQSECLKN